MRTPRGLRWKVTAGIVALASVMAGCGLGDDELTMDDTCEDLVNATPQQQLRFAQDVVDEYHPMSFSGEVEITTTDMAGNFSYNCANNLDMPLAEMTERIVD